MARRLFSSDPESGITRWWNDDDESDKVVMHTQQDITHIVEANKAAYAMYDGPKDKWGDWTRVASIPLSMYMKLKAEGKLHDSKYISRMLNDSENRHLRTRPGKLDLRLEA
jgi:argonaute-like protein implicated in RNA metabolism and viral defense